MGRYLSISAEQLRHIDEVATTAIPSIARTRFRFSVLVELEHRLGRTAVSDGDIDKVITCVMRTMPAPSLALLLEGAA